MARRQQSIDLERSEIAEWFVGRSVLITGASGFMGKVLVEKLLSACPGVKRLFLLLRDKKNITAEKRLDSLKQSPVFDKIRKTKPGQLDKMTAVSGDIVKENLGLSQADLGLLEQVSVVFHTAATVKFDEPLKTSVAINITATESLMKLCKQWPNIEAVVHVSTAYCNCDHSCVEERVYPPPACLARLAAACQCLDDEILQDITPKMIGNRPNTYTFTKAMGEHVVNQHAGAFPVAIFRPSIVTAALESPLPGWVDNLNGPTGLLAGAGKGVVRSLYCRRDFVADLIPVDLAINCMIAVAWHIGVDKPSDVKVYNCTSGVENPIYWHQIESWGHEYLVQHPLDDVFWYPGGSFKDNRYVDLVCVFFMQLLPAYMVDFILWVVGRKNKVTMVQLQTKLLCAVRALEYFATNEWKFVSDNVRALRERLSAPDRVLFYFDVNAIKWEAYIEQYVKGTRKYALKEEDSNIPKAKSHMWRMKVFHYAMKITVVMLFYRAVFLRSGMAHMLSSFLR